MMTRNLFASLTLSLGLLLAGCGNVDPVPTVATLDLSGASQVEIGQPVNVTVQAKDAGGSTVNVTPAFTSSRPDVISVTSTGQLQAKRLTATDQPVTITARVGDKTDTITVSTYGLDIRGGTFKTDTAVYPHFDAWFRDASGHGLTATTKATK